MWEIEGTDEFADWFGSLAADDQEAIDLAVTVLAQDGPALGRPLVDTIASSRHANMKELRPLATRIRILFAFDPRRIAILLLGGDKSGQWDRWYRINIPRADDLYDEYLATLLKEGLL
jgi:hypothetical protein